MRNNEILYTNKKTIIGELIVRLQYFKVEHKDIFRNLLKSILLVTFIVATTIIPVSAETQQTTHNYNVKIQSINYTDNSITIQKDNDLYKLYVDDPENYYLSEIVNITMDNNNEIIDCTVLDEPQIYNTSIIYSNNFIACFRLNNGDVYSFNLDYTDVWKVGDKCKVIIQNDNVLEVRPIK